MRPLGVVLIIIGAYLALPQIVAVAPNQPLFLLGLIVTVAGGVLICDSLGGGAHGDR